MTLIDGTAKSVNAVFARLEIEGVGEGDALRGSAFVADVARRLGIGFPTREQIEHRSLCRGRYGREDRCLAADDVPAIALGAKEVSPYDMASAYGTFANDGERVEPTVIAKIEDASGKVLYEADPTRGHVLPSGVARGVTAALRRVVQGGTGTAAALGDRPVAGKTGTSQAWRDAWFAGFVPQLAAVVWVGNPIPIPGVGNESMVPSNGYPRRIVGGSYPAQIWKAFMSKALEGVPVQDFKDPPEAIFRGGTLPSSSPSPLPSGFTGLESPGAPGTVPSVVGMSFGAADDRLEASGFDADRERGCDPSGNASLHEVYAQSPEGGAEAPQGSEVTIHYEGGGCD